MLRGSTFLSVASFSLTLLALPVSAAPSGTEVGVEVSQRLVAAARLLFDGVTGAPRPVERFSGTKQRVSMLRDFGHQDRTDWSYWPRSRSGLALGEMDASQRRATHELLSSVLSSQGHLKVVHIMQLEDVLRALDTFGFGRDIGDYTLTLFGEPSSSSPWSFRFEGHHVSLNVTVRTDQVRVTPSFFGSNPDEVPSGILSGFRPLRLEEDLGRQLVRSLDEAQQKVAIATAAPPGDVLSGQLGKERSAWQDWLTVLVPDGLSVSAMTDQQKGLVALILEEVFGNYRPQIAAAARSNLDFDALVFRWLGSLEEGEPHYYRLQGKQFVFEYDNVQGNASHIHTVWRERDSDFGEDLLKKHYQDEHR